MTIVIRIGVVIVSVLILAATKPDRFRIQRSININAPPENIFARINDFNRWQAWSSWEKSDPLGLLPNSGSANPTGHLTRSQ